MRTTTPYPKNREERKRAMAFPLPKKKVDITIIGGKVCPQEPFTLQRVKGRKGRKILIKLHSGSNWLGMCCPSQASWNECVYNWLVYTSSFDIPQIWIESFFGNCESRPSRWTSTSWSRRCSEQPDSRLF